MVKVSNKTANITVRNLSVWNMVCLYWPAILCDITVDEWVVRCDMCIDIVLIHTECLLYWMTVRLYCSFSALYVPFYRASACFARPSVRSSMPIFCLNECHIYTRYATCVLYLGLLWPWLLYFVYEYIEKSAQRRRKHCALAVVRRSHKYSPRRWPPSRGRGTAII